MTEWVIYILTMYGLFFACFCVVIWATVVGRIFS